MGYVGVQGANLLFFLAPLGLWISAGVVACLVSSPSVLVRVGALWLAGLIAYSYLASIANKVFLCALYLDASEDVVPAGYDESMMHRVWKTREVRA